MEIESFDDEVKEYKSIEELNQFYNEELEDIQISDLSFKYPNKDEDAISDINLNIKKNRFIVFTGQSGCGKSTILKLLIRLYEPDTGNITLSNHLLDTSYRGLFAYVPQGNQLMSGSIKEIVTFYDSKVDLDRFNQALEIACCNEFIELLPDGVNTLIYENGNSLSEGQLQRLAIARAVYSNRPIFLLDESTSALDEKTERQVLMNLKTLKNKTIILIAHRKTVLPLCDEVIQFKK